jgi:hypothetical protein
VPSHADRHPPSRIQDSQRYPPPSRRYGSFEELLKTTDSTQTVEELGRRFLVDRILVATGTPKTIVDKLEEMHFASGANGGFILGRGYSATDNIREFVELVASFRIDRVPPKVEHSPADSSAEVRCVTYGTCASNCRDPERSERGLRACTHLWTPRQVQAVF